MGETKDITTPLVKAIRGLPGCRAHRLHSGKVKVPRGWMHLEPEGTPDVLAMLPRAAFPGDLSKVAIYFETKSKDGVVSAAQLKQHFELRRLGFRVEVPRSLAEAMKTVREILGARR